MIKAIFFVCIYILSSGLQAETDSQSGADQQEKTDSSVYKIQKKFELAGGYSKMNFTSNISINSQDDSLNKEISLEDDLGFDSKLQFGWIGVNWRFADVHRFSVIYMPMRRTSSFITDKDRTFTVEGVERTIKAGSSIESDFSPDILDIDYIYSFYSRPNLELSASFGLYWVLHSISIEATGQIDVDGDAGTAFEKEYSTKQSMNAPLPLFGFHVDYGFYPDWKLKGSFRYIAAQIGTIDSSILNATLAVEYDFMEEMAVGFGATTFDLSVENDGVVLNNALKWNYSGALMYLKYHY
ncbi:MAG: hypothetical protein HRU20_18985 [Pseudomonadales bacterium]|nr:hypothetical protein [Pseudomonadales bacterium]